MARPCLATNPWPAFLVALCVGAVASAPVAHGRSLSPLGENAAQHMLYAPAWEDDPAFRAAVAAITGGTVEYYDARTGTPSAGQLAAFDCVYTWPNEGYADSVLMGDRLADFVDAGGRVLLGAFCTFTSGHSLGGRIMAAGYSPVTSPGGNNRFRLSHYAGDGGACMYSQVPNFGFVIRDSLVLQGAGVADGHYADGEIALAYRPDFEVVYLNGIPAGCLDEWPRLVANAGTCVSALAALPARAGAGSLACEPCGAPLAAGGHTSFRAARPNTSRGALANPVASTGRNLATTVQDLPLAGANLVGRSNAGGGVVAHSANILTPAIAAAGPRMLYAPSEADDPAYRAAIAAVTGGTVDYFNASADTPDPALLATYDCVYTWVDLSYANPQRFGDLLASFVDAGGKVILGAFCTFSSGNSMKGRIMQPGYSPVWSPFGTNHFSFASLAADGTGCEYAGVSGLGTPVRDYLEVRGGGLADGHYTDGEIAAARRSDARVFYINGCGAVQLGGSVGDWARFVGNAALCPPAMPPATRPSLLGCSADGRLFQLDLGTGAGAWVGTLPVHGGPLNVTELAYDPLADRAWMQSGDGYPSLQEFDPESGAGIGLPVADGASFLGLEFIGATLFGASTTGGSGPSILYAPSTEDDPVFRSALAGYTGGRVDYFDARACTPTAAELAAYDCVFTWMNELCADSALFGDRLADYADAGGRVILGAFCTFRAGNYLGGRIMHPGYCPVWSPSGGNLFSFDTYLGDGTSCVSTGFTAGSYGTPFRDDLFPRGAGVVNGRFTDGEIALAYRPDYRVIHINGGAAGQLPYAVGDWARLVANAARCGFSAILSSMLQVLDTATGTATPIGATGFGPVVGLARDTTADVLYGVASEPTAGSRLIRIDPVTGAGTLVSALGFDAASLEFGPDGALYAGGSQREGGSLYRIALPGGTATLVGPSGFGSITGLLRATRPLVTVANASIPEGDRGVTTARFTLSLSNASPLSVSVHYASADSSATVADGDYEPVSGTAVIPPGESEVAVDVTVHGDKDPEPDEVFLLVLDGPSYARLQADRVTCTLVNDDIVAAVPRGDLWVANGAVHAMTLVGSTLYVGGAFTQIGPATGGAAAIDPVTGSTTSFPKVAGTVYAILSDGAGGWFLGGSFTHLNGVPRANLGHVLADKSVGPWNPAANGRVYVLARDGATIYAGGDFTAIGGQGRDRIAALDAATGDATAWNPVSDGSVRCLSASGGRVIASGYFANIGGAARGRIAALDAGTGAATAWNPGADGAVLALAVSGSVAYVGGDFTNAGGQARGRLAALDLDSDAALAWDPGAGSTVNALALSGATVYAGGAFTTIGGQGRPYIAALDGVSGTPTTWNPGASAAVNALLASGSTVYAGGAFTTIGGQGRNRIAALDAATGLATAWNPNASGMVNALALNGSTLLAGGAFASMGGQPRNRLAALDAGTGSLKPWDPGANGTVVALASSGPAIYAGGAFTLVGNQTRNRIARLDGASGAVAPWDPNANGPVVAIVASGSVVYTGGSFTNIGGQLRNRIAALDAATGLATAWNPNAGAIVNAIAAGGPLVYAGGDFASIGGQPRNRIAALDATTGLATAWDPNAGASVRALAVNGSIVYAGGDFTTIGGAARNRVAALSPDTGLATAWNPNAGGVVRAIAVNGATVYLGGDFTTIGASNRDRLACLDAGTGWLSSWNPGANAAVRALVPSGTSLFAAGDFTAVAGQPQAYVVGIAQGVLEVPEGQVSSSELSLAPVYPNPADGEAVIEYTVPRADRIRIRVLDVQGRLVATLVDRTLAPGRYRVTWSVDGGRNATAPGIYFVRLQSSQGQVSRRVVSLR